ncbi:MAG TPA: phosphate ABC transporter ATP-binding protein PstB [Candidatus Andersenbacteria bacterium]|nr:phosphate ABC transporter ATP-binding protein PstB [Candidatus Andersenbacteria bacterium]
MKTVFSVRDLDTHYGAKPVLKQVSLDVPAQSVTAIIGPSGCGKSTFLRCLNRMNDLAPDFRHRGRVLYHGEDIYEPQVDVIHLRRRVGMVFQKPNPFPKSIFDNVAYGLRIHGMNNKAHITERVHDSLVKAALWQEVHDRLSASALALSGGQQQRLCIARAIAVAPDVILFDEPCSALDPIAARKIEALMVSLKRDYTIIVVTHNLQQARRIADYVGFFHLGELVEFGAANEVFERPIHQLTRDYVQGVFG